MLWKSLMPELRSHLLVAIVVNLIFHHILHYWTWWGALVSLIPGVIGLVVRHWLLTRKAAAVLLDTKRLR